MAAGAWQVYGAAIEAIARAQMDLDLDPFAIVLVTNAYTPSVDVDDTWSDLSANEATGTGYIAKDLTTVTVTRTGSPTSGTVTFDCADVSWTSSTITAKYAVIVRKAVGSPSQPAGTDLLLCYSDLDTGGGSVSTTNGTFAINMHANGVFTIARA